MKMEIRSTERRTSGIALLLSINFQLFCVTYNMPLEKRDVNTPAPSQANLKQIAANSGVDIAGILGIDTVSTNNTDAHLSSFNWNTLLGGQADPKLLADIYDAVDTGNFDADLLQRIDGTINKLVDGALSGGGVTGATKEDIKYFIKYSYLDLCDALKLCELLDTIDIDRLIDKIPEKYFVLAIRIFQQLWSLPVTGRINDGTRGLMNKSRCGGSDAALIAQHTGIATASSRRKRFVIGRAWLKPAITYRILNNPKIGTLTADEVSKEIARAFGYWTAACMLTITKIDSGTADIMIMFAVRDHMDGFPFDGKGGTLAHAFLPNDGTCHFDDDEGYVSTSEKGTNLFQVAVHELGHSQGMDHSLYTSAVMYPYYKPSIGADFTLSFDDIEAVGVMYGLRGTSPQPPGPAVDPPWTTDLWCSNGKPIDAAYTDIDGVLYLFHNAGVTAVTSDGVKSSFPKFINDAYPDLPKNTPLDDVFRLPNLYKNVPCDSTGNCKVLLEETRTYFFMGKNYYSYKESSFIEQGVISTKFVGLPPNLDAAWTMRDGNMYFLKNGFLFRATRNLTAAGTYQVDSGYPQPFFKVFSDSSLQGASVSAVETMYQGSQFFYTYVFHEDMYHRFKDMTSTTADTSKAGPFPRKYSQWFTRCGSFTPITSVDSTGTPAKMLEEVVMADSKPPDMMYVEPYKAIVPNIRALEMVALSAASVLVSHACQVLGALVVAAHLFYLKCYRLS